MGYGPIACAKWAYYYRKCSESSKKCKEDLDKKYPNILDLCLETDSRNQDEAYFKKCFLQNPDCKPMIEAGAACSIWPHGGLLKFLKGIFE